LRCKRNNEAIMLFGRAAKHLVQHENRADFIAAQTYIALAYEDIGLLWAARASYTFAVNQVYNLFSEDGEMPIVMSTLLNHLIWIEIRLGRVPYALTWLRQKHLIDSKILDLNQNDDLKKNNQLIDAILGILILKTRYDDLNNLNFLPSILDRFGLHMSSLATLYALGYEDAVRHEFGERVDDLFEFFTLWLNQPANADLPVTSEWYTRNRISLVSSVLGLKFIMDLPNDMQIISFAESILSSAEGFLATGISRKISPATPLLKCVLEIDTSIDQFRLEEKEDDCGEVTYMIKLPNKDVLQLIKEKKNIELLFPIVAEIIGKNILIFGEIESMIAEDLAFDRMTQFFQLPITISNIFGENVSSSLKQWESAAGPERFSLLRIKPWSDNLYHSNSRFNYDDCLKKEDSPILDLEEKHCYRSFVSIINQRVWEKAGWTALFVAIIPAKPIKLILGLTFKKKEEALKIFRGWKKKIGDVDVNEIINISIVTGIDRKNPYHYRLLISPAFHSMDIERSKHLTYSPQIVTMTPDNSINLDNFRKALALGVGYYLAPVTCNTRSNKPILEDEKYWIKKTKINIIEAWKVKEGDIEVPAITPDSDPIIPGSVKNAPVLSIMQRHKNLEKKTANPSKK
jgi:hypothetical protein